MMSPVAWLAVGLVLMGLEIVAPGFVIFWFGAGSLVVALLTALGCLDDLAWQWGVFFIASIFFLGLWQIWLKKVFRRETLDTARDPTVSGQTGVVVRAIAPGQPGEVEMSVPLYGIKRWQAEADSVLDCGVAVVVVEARGGVRLLVRSRE